MHPGRKGVDSETAFVIAIIVVFIVIGVFVFIYACCVTEEKLKAATKKKASQKKKDTAAPPAAAAPAAPTAAAPAAPLAPAADSKAKPSAAAAPSPVKNSGGDTRSAEIVLTVQEASPSVSQHHPPAPAGPVMSELTPTWKPLNTDPRRNGIKSVASEVAPASQSTPTACDRAYSVHL
uniref:Translation initiation factor if 2 n=1 Tax=Rhipicephalus zambeziensis TaxID=60191 RepID=A0A224ZAW7_9ACAR